MKLYEFHSWPKIVGSRSASDQIQSHVMVFKITFDLNAMMISGHHILMTVILNLRPSKCGPLFMLLTYGWL